MDAKTLGNTLLSIQDTLNNTRVGLKEDVFLERHLPTIIKNGKPTVDMSIELSRIAGGENKRINIIDDNGKIVLTLPSALSSGNTINNPNSKESIKVIRDINSVADGKLSDKNLNKFDNRVEEVRDKHISELKTDWGYVIDHYKEKIKIEEPVIESTKPKSNLRKNISFEY